MNFIPRNCHLFLVLWLLPQTTTASASAVWLLQVWHLKLTYTLVFGLFAIFRRHKLLEAFLTFSMWSICLSFFVADLLVTGVKALACMMALSTTACCTLHTSCGSIDDSISHTRSLSSTSLDSISTCDHSMTCDPQKDITSAVLLIVKTQRESFLHNTFVSNLTLQQTCLSPHRPRSICVPHQ